MELLMEDKLFIEKDDISQEDFLDRFITCVSKLISTSYGYKTYCVEICKRYGAKRCLLYPLGLRFWVRGYIYREFSTKEDALISPFEVAKGICKDIISGKISMWISYENDNLDIFSITPREKSSDGSVYFRELLADGTGRVLKTDTGEFLNHIIGPVISYKWLQHEGYPDSIILNAMNNPVYRAYRIIRDIHN